MSSTEPRRLRADAARNRQLLIDAAEELFAARGLDVTLDDIARRAGVNVATAYRNFANKHELAQAFLQRSVDQAVAVADEAAANPDPWDGLTQFLRRCLELVARNHSLIDVLTRAYGTGWFEQLRDRMRQPVEELLARGRRQGVIRRDLARTDIGMILKMLGAVAEFDADDAQLAPRYLSLLLVGLRPSDTPLDGEPPTDEQLQPMAPMIGSSRAVPVQ
jgi:AcrR family transcriptional regulator